MTNPVNTNALRESALDLEPVRADERLSNTQWARVHIAKRALFTAADEVDRLRDRAMDDARDRERLRIDFNARSAEASRLRAVIENAPHEMSHDQPCYAGMLAFAKCTCWKAGAL